MLIYRTIPQPLLNDVPLKKVTIGNFKTFFGEPSDVELPDSGTTDEPLTICHYDDRKFSLFFQEDILTTVSVYDTLLQMFDQNIFKLKEKEIIALFESNGIKEYEIDRDWGEKQLVFDTAGITFFFDNQKVSEVFIDIL